MPYTPSSCDSHKKINNTKVLRFELLARNSSVAGFSAGGNTAHLAPEILNAKPGPKKYLNYSKQPVWAAGVLAYELAGIDSVGQYHPNLARAHTAKNFVGRIYFVAELTNKILARKIFMCDLF